VAQWESLIELPRRKILAWENAGSTAWLSHLLFGSASLVSLSVGNATLAMR